MQKRLDSRTVSYPCIPARIYTYMARIKIKEGVKASHCCWAELWCYSSVVAAWGGGKESERKNGWLLFGGGGGGQGFYPYIFVAKSPLC